MAGLFRMDGPFIKYGSLLFDMIALSCVWTLTSGVGIALYIFMMTTFFFTLPPIVSFLIVYVLMAHWAPATTALLYTLGKKVRGTDSYAMKDYFHAYASNYKQSMILSALLTFVLMLILLNLWIISQNMEGMGNIAIVLFALEILVGIEIIFAMVYMAGLIARFEMGTKEYLKASLVLSNKYLPITVLLVALLAASIYGTCFFNLILFAIVPSVYGILSAVFLEHVFKNYIPTEEDEIEEELEEDSELDAERQAIVDRYMNMSAIEEERKRLARNDEPDTNALESAPETMSDSKKE